MARVLLMAGYLDCEEYTLFPQVDVHCSPTAYFDKGEPQFRDVRIADEGMEFEWASEADQAISLARQAVKNKSFLGGLKKGIYSEELKALYEQFEFLTEGEFEGASEEKLQEEFVKWLADRDSSSISNIFYIEDGDREMQSYVDALVPFLPPWVEVNEDTEGGMGCAFDFKYLSFQDGYQVEDLVEHLNKALKKALKALASKKKSSNAK